MGIARENRDNRQMGDNASVEELEKLLETFVENTRQLGITVNDFQPSSQAVLNQKINFLVTGLQDIDRAKGSVQRVVIPTEVLAYIDQGRNPTLYTKIVSELASKLKTYDCKSGTERSTFFPALVCFDWFDLFPSNKISSNTAHKKKKTVSSVLFNATS